MELTVKEYIPSGAEAGRQKMQCKCVSMMCEEEGDFLNTMESYIVRLKRWLKNMDYLGIHQHITYKGAKQQKKRQIVAKRHKRRKLCYGAKNIRADMRWQQHLELERFPFQPESIQETGHQKKLFLNYCRKNRYVLKENPIIHWQNCVRSIKCSPAMFLNA